MSFVRDSEGKKIKMNKEINKCKALFNFKNDVRQKEKNLRETLYEGLLNSL